jgi:Ser/Thr protein kinase RdoA (MazF antagonist)
MSATGLNTTARSALTAWASIVEPYRIESMPRATNAIWRLQVYDGPALILKQLPEYPPGVPPVVEFRVLCHLQGAGVPVALPIITDDGSIHAVVEGRHWVLLPFLPGQAGSQLGSDEAGSAFAIGRAIGHLGQALADCPWRVESFVDDPAKVVHDTLPQLPDEVVNLVRPHADRLRQACSGLSAQLTHGDCNEGNVLVDGGRVTGFLDLDHLPTGPRVRDLAYYLASRLRTHLSAADRGQRPETSWHASVGSYVAGYHSAYPLTEHERNAVVPLMLLAEVSGAHWSLHGWQPDDANYRRNLRSIAWITEHFDELASAS